MLPNPGHSYAQERLGIAAVQSWAASVGQIWREIGTGDVGIDGQFEFVNSDGFATGKTLAVQVKSGPSFFSRPAPDGWHFSPHTKHIIYWESYPLPVILVLHNPETKLSYWVDARQQLRLGANSLFVPTHNILQNTNPITMFGNVGVQDSGFIEPTERIIENLIITRIDRDDFILSYFDIFTHGLTNICRSIYFDMGVASDAASYNVAKRGVSPTFGVRGSDQVFIFEFVKFLVAQNLANIDFSDCLIDWEESQMQPFFVAPLTRRGRDVVDYIGTIENRFIDEGHLEDSGLRVAQEGFVSMERESYFSRVPRIAKFQEFYLELNKKQVTT